MEPVPGPGVSGSSSPGGTLVDIPTETVGNLIPGRVQPQGHSSGLDADTLDGMHASAFAGGAHAVNHEDGGTDEIDVTGLSGVLADPQTPAAHTHAPADVTPQGTGSGLDADTVDGMHAAAFESAGAVATHVGAADPHAQYQKESEKGVASGYASLDAGTKLPLAQLPSHAATHKGGGTDVIDAATVALAGLMSAADKSKLDGIQALANRLLAVGEKLTLEMDGFTGPQVSTSMTSFVLQTRFPVNKDAWAIAGATLVIEFVALLSGSAAAAAGEAKLVDQVAGDIAGSTQSVLGTTVTTVKTVIAIGSFGAGERIIEVHLRRSAGSGGQMARLDYAGLRLTYTKT